MADLEHAVTTSTVLPAVAAGGSIEVAHGLDVVGDVTLVDTGTGKASPASWAHTTPDDPSSSVVITFAADHSVGAFMARITGQSSTPLESTTPPGGGGVPPVLGDPSGSLQGAIVGANGDIIDCTVYGSRGPYHLANDPGIFGAPPVDIEVVDSAGLTAGDLHGRTRHLSKPVRWSINVLADTPNGLHQALERLTRAVTPVVPGSTERRSCRLVVIRPDGTARQIVGTYSTGLDGVDIETNTVDAVRVDLVFRCPDPFWAAVDGSEVFAAFPITGTGVVATPFSDPATLFSAPGIPFNGFASTDVANTAETTLTVQGNAESWPLWRVQGSAASVEVINRATGNRWSWAGVLASGEELVIDTVDQAPSARLDGVNAYGGLAAGSRLFPLAPGDNRVVFKVTGADTGSSMTVEWQDRWLTP